MAGLRAVIPADAVPPPINVQRGFGAPGASAFGSLPEAPALRLRLRGAERRSGRIVIHVRHDSDNPGSDFAPGLPDAALRDGFAPEPDEALATKSVNAAFVGDLDLRQRRLGATTIVALGPTADRCVSTTARVGSNMGYCRIVVADGCAAFDQPGLGGATIAAAQAHAVRLAILANEFAEVALVEEVVADLDRV